MHKLGGGYSFTKNYLANAYNQIKLGPKSQKKLALSTHKGVLLQKRLPFGIKSAPGYFQQIMDQLTQELPGVAVYLYNLLVSGKDAEDHIKNLRGLLQRLNQKGLHCRLEKCHFATFLSKILFRLSTVLCKFLPPNLSTIAEPLYSLTKKRYLGNGKMNNKLSLNV